jgi:hypothetical protein
VRIFGVLALASAACTPGPRDVTADASIDSGDDAAYEPTWWRRPTAAILGPNRVVWSLGSNSCSHESIECGPVSPTILAADLTSVDATPLVSTHKGVSIVGDETEQFFVNSDDYNHSYVVRVRREASWATTTAMSIPRQGVAIVGVDDTYVYWIEPTGIRRATRDGDGSDVVTLQGDGGGYLHAGYFWSSACNAGACTVRRTPSGGGTAEVVANLDAGVIGVANDRLLLKESDGMQFPRYRVVAMTIGGTTEVLTDFLEQCYAPWAVAVAGNDIFWTTCLSSNMFRLPLTGGVPAQITGFAPVERLEPFVVTPDAILYGFDDTGYHVFPR